MEVLSSRILLRPTDWARSVTFYRDVLGLRTYREYGVDGAVTGIVLFLGGGYLELASTGPTVESSGVRLWLQVADVDAVHADLAGHDVEVVTEPETMPWGLREMWISDPDGVRIAIVEVPADHPIRRRVD